jgi:hypothetical protein
MGVDGRFSAERFQRLSSDPEGVARLIGDLEDAVREELHPVIVARFREIAGGLNGLGHHLVLDDEEPGELSYHDPSDPPAGAHRRLRVGVDAIVSAAWPGTAPEPPAGEPPTTAACAFCGGQIEYTDHDPIGIGVVER